MSLSECEALDYFAVEHPQPSSSPFRIFESEKPEDKKNNPSYETQSEIVEVRTDASIQEDRARRSNELGERKNISNIRERVR